DGPDDLDEVEVKIPGVTNGSDIDNGDEETFEVDPNKNYNVTCEKISGYILVSNPHPIPVNPLKAGEGKKVTCEYVTDTGADDYDPNEDYDFFGNEKSCLSYEDRDLTFTDLKPNQLGYAEAQVLKNTFFSLESSNEDIEGLKKSFILSGYDSKLSGTNKKEAQISLPNQATRMEVTLTVMKLHCLPIFRGSSLPNTRLDGNPMPKVT